jgi:heterodisulfide reductase subunit B
MKYALFLGCLIPQRIPSVELASRKLFERLGIEIVDLSGYSCCPDPVIARLADRRMSLVFSARNLSLAEQLGLDVVTLCNGCYETLWEANEAMKREGELKEEVNKVLSEVGRKYEGLVNVKHVVEVLYEDVGVGRIKNTIIRPLTFRAAVHPGCHLFREADGEDIWRKPRMLTELVRSTGADVVSCKLDRMCCGFPMMQVNEEAALKERLYLKLRCYEELMVEGIITTCPTCILQFETGQISLRKYGLRYNFPCLHIVELLALAVGIPASELKLEFHRSPVAQLIEKMGM